MIETMSGEVLRQRTIENADQLGTQAETMAATVGDPETKVVVEAIRDEGPIHQATLSWLPGWLRVLTEMGVDGCGGLPGTPAGERRIRAVVNRARIVWMLPIASCPKGYFIPQTAEQVDEFVGRIQREAKARAISSMLTAKKMRECFGRKQQDVCLSLMEEAAEMAKQDGPRAERLLEVIRMQRRHIEALQARLARWGRPSDKSRMERNDGGQPKFL